LGYAVTIGFFDGVHSGHRFVLEQLKQIAAQSGCESAVVVFEDHPQTVLHGVQVPLLTTYSERVALLKQAGIDRILSFRFADIRSLTAEAFMRLLHEQYGAELLIMGYDHRFGSDRLQAPEAYDKAAARVGLRLVRLPRNPRSAASSTAIRKALLAGDTVGANALLGYPYTLTGTVVSGRGIGREIGFPTANLRLPQEKLVPAAGVYACEAEGHRAVLNIGTNPTVNGTEQTIELHIPAFTGDLYGKQLTVRLLHFLRPEKKFDSIDDLQKQIAADIEQIAK